LAALSQGWLAPTMIPLDRRQRDALSYTIRELANLIVAALVVGPFVTQLRPSWRLILSGTVIWMAFVGCGLLLEQERRW
jgi:hypothetical protein